MIKLETKLKVIFPGQLDTILFFFEILTEKIETARNKMMMKKNECGRYLLFSVIPDAKFKFNKSNGMILTASLSRTLL